MAVMAVMAAIALPAWAKRELKIQIGGAGRKSPALLFSGLFISQNPLSCPRPRRCSISPIPGQQFVIFVRVSVTSHSEDGFVSRVDFDQYAGQYEAILAAQTPELTRAA